MLDLDEASITIENCIIRNSASYGITLDNSSKFVSFANNTITNTVNHVIGLYPNAVHTIKGGNVLTSVNSSIGIEIKGGTYNQAEETWLAQSVPYIINGIVYIESNSGAVLNIQEGTTIAFTNGSQLEVGSSSSTYGTIKAIGTTTAPITFTSSATQKTAGDWDAIFLNDGTSSSSAFAFCKFEYGGGYASYVGMVDMDDCSASFTNCSFENSATYGITLDDGSQFTSFENNSFSNCVNHPVQIYGNYAHTIGTGNVYNSSLGILVKGDDYNQANETWKKQSCPYYIDGIVYIGSSTASILTIEAGTQIFLHKNSNIYVLGTLIINGTKDNPVIIRGDRLEHTYDNVPGQWGRIVFINPSKNNFINYAEIKGGIIGIQVGGVIESDEKPDLHIANSKIEHMNYACLFSIGGKILASNCVIADAGFYNIALLLGGNYEFYHCTSANYWNYATRKDPSLIISNNIVTEDAVYVSDLEKCYFGNCIVYGNNENEIAFSNESGAGFNYFFENCLIKASNDFDFGDNSNYQNIWNNLDPKFVSYTDYNWHLDTLSPAENKGEITIVTNYTHIPGITTDIEENNRTLDNLPDLGAYERTY
jgi:hypothetical protein